MIAVFAIYIPREADLTVLSTLTVVAEQICSRFLPFSVTANNGKMLCRTLPRIVEGPQPHKGGEGKVTVSAHWNKHFLMDALSSVSEQSVNYSVATVLHSPSIT